MSEEDVTYNEDRNIKGNKDMTAKVNEDIDIEENGGYNITTHKLTAGSEADSNTGSDEYNTLAEPKQDAIPINNGALTKVTKNNTASEYITSIDKLADSVNQSSPSKLNAPEKIRRPLPRIRRRDIHQ